MLNQIAKAPSSLSAVWNAAEDTSEQKISSGVSFWQTIQDMTHVDESSATQPKEKSSKEEKELSIEDFRLLVLLIMSGADEETITAEIANALGISQEQLGQLSNHAGLKGLLLNADSNDFTETLSAVNLSAQTKADIEQLRSLAHRERERQQMDQQQMWQIWTARSFFRASL